MTARNKNTKISGFQGQNATIKSKRNSSPKNLSVQRNVKEESKKSQNIR